MSARPRVIIVCGREAAYVRNAMIWRTLSGAYDAELLAGRAHRPLSREVLRLIPRLIQRLRRPHDLVFVGFYGHPLLLAAGALTRAPLVFDPFVATYDTLVADRGSVAAGSPVARLLHGLDRAALRRADLVLADTDAHAAYYAQEYGIPPAKFATLYLGCDATEFAPRPAPPREPTARNRFIVFTYTTYQPLHGIPTVLRAAQRCVDLPIEFQIVGSQGPTYAAARAEAAALGLTNVRFVPSMPFAALPDAIAAADVCLGGHFGTSDKSQRVIAGKSYQFVAMGKPVILADNAANRELFTHGDTAYLCAPNAPDALAHAVIDLYRRPDVRAAIAQRGHALYLQQLTWDVLGQELVGQVGRLLAGQ